MASAITRPLIVLVSDEAAGARGDCPRAGCVRTLRSAAVRARLVRATFVLPYYFACAALGRFAPYFDRPCLRFSTPAASKVPRTM